MQFIERYFSQCDRIIGGTRKVAWNVFSRKWREFVLSLPSVAQRSLIASGSNGTSTQTRLCHPLELLTDGSKKASSAESVG